MRWWQKTRVTLEEAKAVWDSLAVPSPARVQQVFAQAGRRLHRNKVKAWVDAGWVEVDKSGDPALDALNAVDAASSVLTMNPQKRMADLIPRLPYPKHRHAEDMRNLRKLLEDASDDALLRESNRRLMITTGLMLKEVERHMKRLINDKPKEAGALMESLAQCQAVAIDGMDRLVMLRERAMKLVGNNENETVGQEVIPPEPQSRRPLNEDPLYRGLIAFGARAPEMVGT